MEQRNGWAEGPRRQWIFYAEDNSSLEGLSEKIDPGQVYCPEDTQAVNLGIRRVKGRLLRGKLCGTVLAQRHKRQKPRRPGRP